MDLAVNNIAELHGISIRQVESEYTLEDYYKILYFKSVESANRNQKMKNVQY